MFAGCDGLDDYDTTAVVRLCVIERHDSVCACGQIIPGRYLNQREFKRIVGTGADAPVRQHGEAVERGAVDLRDRPRGADIRRKYARPSFTNRRVFTAEAEDRGINPRGRRIE